MCIGDNSCCTSRSRCGIGEGDCDADNECLGGLVCGNPGNCATYSVHLTDVYSFSTLKESFSASDACCQPSRYMLEDYILEYRKEVVKRGIEEEGHRQGRMDSLVQRSRG